MARSANFRCPETGKEFLISQFSLGFSGTVKYYKDKNGERLINPDNGKDLEYIQKEVDYSTISMNGTSEERRDKDIKHYKDVADKHNQTEEVRHTKFKAIEREMGTEVAETTQKIEDSKRKK